MRSLKSLSWIAFFLVFNGCSKDEMRSRANKAPVADAGESVTLILPQSATTLDGRASSDSDGTIVSYQWKQISGLPCIIDEPKKSVTVAKNFRAGTYKFELTVTDNNGSSSKDIKIVEVINPTAGTNPPIAYAGEDDTVLLSQPYAFLDGGGSSDPDGTLTSYEWRQISGPSVCVIEEPGKPQSRAKNFSTGTYEFELTVTDDDGLSATDIKRVEVIDSALPVKEIVNSNLQWQYLPKRGLISARLTDLQDPPGPNSADSIDAVYKFSNYVYIEVPRGNPANSDNIYFEIETKSLLLQKKYSVPNLDTTKPYWQLSAAIAFAIAMPNLNLPKKAKVVFRR